MRLRLLVAAAAMAATLAATPAASAKELQSLSVCGTAGCEKLSRSPGSPVRRFLERGAEPVSAPAQASPFYMLRVRVDGGGETIAYKALWLPSAGLMRGGDRAGGFNWQPVPAATARALRRATRELGAFPASDLDGGLDVTVPTEAAIAGTTVYPATASADDAGLPWLWLAVGAALVALIIGRLRTTRSRSRQDRSPTGSRARRPAPDRGR